MKKLWILLGRLAGYLSWPLVWVVIRFTMRSKLLLVCEGQILLLKGWLGVGQWGLLGGGLHTGEDPADGAIRETKEEIGIVVRKTHMQNLGTFRQSRGLAHTFHGFVIELPKKPGLNLRWNEITEARWVQPSELANLHVEQHVQLMVDAWQASR